MAKTPVRSVLDRAVEAASEKLKHPATQVEIARLAGGIKQPSVAEWKTGKPDMEKAITFAVNTGVCVEWFLTERGPKRPWDVEEEMDPLLAEIRRIWSLLDPEGRRELADFARFLELRHPPSNPSPGPGPSSPLPPAPPRRGRGSDGGNGR